MPLGRKKKATKKKKPAEQGKAHVLKELGNVSLRVEIEDLGVSQISRQQISTIKKKYLENNNNLTTSKESTSSTVDPYDADSEFENNFSINKDSSIIKPEPNLHLKECEQFKPTPLLSRFVSNLHSSDHSTPSCDSSAAGTDDSCFGFDALDKQLPFSPVLADENIPPPPAFSLGSLSSFHNSTSPVSNPSPAKSSSSSVTNPSPMKRVSSVSNSSQGNRTKSLGIITKPIEKPVKKIKRKAAPKKGKNDNAWTSELTDLFKDVEMHELLIE